ncbi:hypothetical protein JCM4814A_69490 [Streptomyces phaeofaciens JCM 4814]|uniref:Uncharacterized protein n=1 Tax=Streptomyces phaeofaciens TaxID=68254 RepID=A0A918H8M9_9ACTN|nr:hypothetical protein GCM10010226_18140 [Streptomyces phaeofaciens]
MPGAGVGGEVQQVGGAPSDQAFGRAAEYFAERLVGVDDHAIAVDERHGERGGREDRPVERGVCSRRPSRTGSCLIVTLCDG